MDIRRPVTQHDRYTRTSSGIDATFGDRKMGEYMIVHASRQDTNNN